MVNKYYIILLIFAFLNSPVLLQAQKDQIPIETVLENASQRELIKIGMKTASKPAKLKFGAYSNDNRKGVGMTQGSNPVELLFSFDLKNTNGNVARVEASGKKEIDKPEDISVYISTDLDQDDLWVLLVSKSSNSKDLALKDIFLTNGTDEILFRHIIGEPTNNSEITAPKGIEASIDDYPIAAMQYYSGGSFSYKKFIWISEKTEAHLQLVMAAVFATLLEIGDYFDGNGFTE